MFISDYSLLDFTLLTLVWLVVVAATARIVS